MSQRNGKDEPDHLPVLKLFNPCGAATWLLSEIDPEEQDIAFGLADLGMDYAELSSVSLAELRSIRLPFGPSSLGTLNAFASALKEVEPAQPAGR